MANRTTFVDVSDGDQLSEGYFNTLRDFVVKVVDQDQTAAEINNSATETEIAEVEVAANEVESGVLVIATGFFINVGITNRIGTVRLYGGTSATATNNTLFKTLTINIGSAAGNTKSGWTIVYWIDSLTFSSLNFINITGQNSAIEAGVKTGCDSLVVVSI